MVKTENSEVYVEESWFSVVDAKPQHFSHYGLLIKQINNHQ
jgi:hypothetical protein